MERVGRDVTWWGLGTSGLRGCDVCAQRLAACYVYFSIVTVTPPDVWMHVAKRGALAPNIWWWQEVRLRCACAYSHDPELLTVVDIDQALFDAVFFSIIP